MPVASILVLAACAGRTAECQPDDAEAVPGAAVSSSHQVMRGYGVNAILARGKFIPVNIPSQAAQADRLQDGAPVPAAMPVGGRAGMSTPADMLAATEI